MHSKFETEIAVRPSDIDSNRHVHQSIYMDYLLAARVDQMKRCYGMSLQEFFRRGFSWVTKSIRLDFHSPVGFGETVIVRTWVEKVGRKSVSIRFEILKPGGQKKAAEGESTYVLVDTETGKPRDIPDDIKLKYSI